MLVVLCWCSEPKINYVPSASWRPVQKAPVKRVSRSETSSQAARRRGTPTRRLGWKLRAAVSAVAVLNVGTGHTLAPTHIDQQVDMHLQEVMAGAGDGQFEDV